MVSTAFQGWVRAVTVSLSQGSAPSGWYDIGKNSSLARRRRSRPASSEKERPCFITARAQDPSKVLFNNNTSEIVTCFKDDTIMLWTADRLEFIAQLPPPPSSPVTSNRAQLRTYSINASGRYLAAGGRSKSVLMTCRLL